MRKKRQACRQSPHQNESHAGSPESSTGRTLPAPRSDPEPPELDAALANDPVRTAGDAAAHRKFQALHKETSVNADPFRPNLALSGSDRAMRHECAMRESAFARSMRHGFFPLGHSVIMAHSVCATD